MATTLSVTTPKGERIRNPYDIPFGIPQIRITPYWKFGPNPPRQYYTGTGWGELSASNKLLEQHQLMINSKLPILGEDFSIGGISDYKVNDEDIGGTLWLNLRLHEHR